MSKQSKKSKSPEDNNTWILNTKRVGDPIAGWVVERVYENDIRLLENSERCAITSYCYPKGAKMIRAKLQRADSLVAA